MRSQVLGTLRRISMTQNGINHPGISALAKALSKNTGLQVLDLNDNTFTAKGAAAVAEVRNKSAAVSQSAHKVASFFNFAAPTYPLADNFLKLNNL